MATPPCPRYPPRYPPLTTAHHRSPPLSSSQTYCTRNEFTLLLLLQQGIVSGDDIQRCREAFAQLDTDGSGRLDDADLIGWPTEHEVKEEAAAAAPK